jgi:hypothetical protein
MSRPTTRTDTASAACSRLRRSSVAVIAGALLLTACGSGEPTLDPIDPGPQPTGDDEAAGTGLTWDHLDVVEATLPDRAAASVVEDPDEIAAVWERLGFESGVPTLDPATDVLLLLGRADNACPDELIVLEVVDERLVTEWLEPPGGCVDPLIHWVHAVQVHRGVLGEQFTYALEEPFADDLEPVTITLAAFDDDGSRRAPTPPQAMSDDEVDAVFADHPIRRCGPDDDPIADAFGPLDEPVDEFDPDQETALEQVDAAMAVLTDAGFEPHADVSGLIDRSTGTSRAAVVVHEPRAEEVQDLLDAELGPGTVTVRADPWDAREVQAAQEALGALMGPGSDGPGAIVSTSGAPGPVEIGMVDPTREALDAIADRVDAELVCVDVIRSGVGPQPTG